MGMNTTPIRIILTDDERRELEQIARGHVVAHRDVVRAQIILRVAAGASLSRVASDVGRQRCVVRKWANRFLRRRLRGLADAPRSGRPARFSPQSGNPPGQARL